MIDQYLHIATSHIKPETLGFLEYSSYESRRCSGWPDMTIASYEFGVFVTVPRDCTERQKRSIPNDLAIVLDFARERNLTLIRLSKNAKTIDEIPVYKGRLQLQNDIAVNANVSASTDKDEIVARMKHEVLRDITDGTVPVSIKSFSDLHEHVDANYYGGFTDKVIVDALVAAYGNEGYIRFIDECQKAVDTWLDEGRKTKPDGSPASMHRLNVSVHFLDDLVPFLDEYGVKIVDKSGAPDSVIFEGSEEGLHAMFVEHWNEAYPGSYPV